MEEKIRGILVAILRPVVYIACRYSIPLREFVSICKELYVEAAERELRRRGEKVNVSRLSTISGVHRKDVYRIKQSGSAPMAPLQVGRRVITQWRRDNRFRSPSGRPRVLTLSGTNSEFSHLVKSVSKEVGQMAILCQLEQMGAVEQVKGGVRLRAKAFQPDRGSIENLQLLAEDVEDLIMAVLANIEEQGREMPNIHAKTQFDNISDIHLEAIRGWFDRKCFQWHQEVERYLSRFDIDTSDAPLGDGGHRIAFAIFTRT